MSRVSVPAGTIDFQQAWEDVDAWLGASRAPEHVVRCNMALAVHYETEFQNAHRAEAELKRLRAANSHSETE